MEQINEVTNNLINDIDKLKTDICISFVVGNIDETFAQQIIKQLKDCKTILERK